MLVILFSDGVAMITIARHHCGRMAGTPVRGRRHQDRAVGSAGIIRVLKGEAAVGGRRQGAVWAVPAPGLRRSRAQAQERDGGAGADRHRPTHSPLDAGTIRPPTIGGRTMAVLSRREFLRLAGATAALGPAEAVGASAAEVPGPLRPTHPLETFDYVVVLILENRSFDNLLGYLYESGTMPRGQRFEGNAGKSLANPIPPDAEQAQRQVVPMLSTLARQFAMCDHWHCEVPSQTFCNRAFFHADSSA